MMGHEGDGHNGSYQQLDLDLASRAVADNWISNAHVSDSLILHEVLRSHREQQQSHYREKIKKWGLTRLHEFVARVGREDHFQASIPYSLMAEKDNQRTVEERISNGLHGFLGKLRDEFYQEQAYLTTLLETKVREAKGNVAKEAVRLGSSDRMPLSIGSDNGLTHQEKEEIQSAIQAEQHGKYLSLLEITRRINSWLMERGLSVQALQLTPQGLKREEQKLELGVERAPELELELELEQRLEQAQQRQKLEPAPAPEQKQKKQLIEDLFLAPENPVNAEEEKVCSLLASLITYQEDTDWRIPAELKTLLVLLIWIVALHVGIGEGATAGHFAHGSEDLNNLLKSLLGFSKPCALFWMGFIACFSTNTPLVVDAFNKVGDFWRKTNWGLRIIAFAAVLPIGLMYCLTSILGLSNVTSIPTISPFPLGVKVWFGFLSGVVGLGLVYGMGLTEGMKRIGFVDPISANEIKTVEEFFKNKLDVRVDSFTGNFLLSIMKRLFHVWSTVFGFFSSHWRKVQGKDTVDYTIKNLIYQRKHSTTARLSPRQYRLTEGIVPLATVIGGLMAAGFLLRPFLDLFTGNSQKAMSEILGWSENVSGIISSIMFFWAAIPVFALHSRSFHGVFNFVTNLIISGVKTAANHWAGRQGGTPDPDMSPYGKQQQNRPFVIYTLYFLAFVNASAQAAGIYASSKMLEIALLFFGFSAGLTTEAVKEIGQEPALLSVRSFAREPADAVDSEAQRGEAVEPAAYYSQQASGASPGKSF